MFWKAGLLLIFWGLVVFELFVNRKAAIALRNLCPRSWEGISWSSFGNGAWGSLCCLLNRVTHTKTSTSAVWHAPKPAGQKGSANQIKPVLEQLELYAFLNQNINVKFLINTSQCTAALTWHCCSGLLFWVGEQGRAVPPRARKMEKYCGFASQKQLPAFPPQPEAMDHPLLSMVKNVSSQHWGKFWKSPGVPGMQTQYWHWQICVNSFGAP